MNEKNEGAAGDDFAAYEKAVAALADRAIAMAEALPALVMEPRRRPDALLSAAVKAVILKGWGSSGAINETVAAYARRICIEQGIEPNTLVSVEEVPVAQLLGETRPIAFTDHFQRLEPAWVRVYRRLPSMENLEGDKLNHVRGRFGRGCEVCGATHEEFADGVINPYACPGPCTEARLLWKVDNSRGTMECWQAPAKDGTVQRYIRRVGAMASMSEAADFERWKRENAP